MAILMNPSNITIVSTIVPEQEPEHSAIYPVLLEDKSYFTLYRFLERANNFMDTCLGRLGSTMCESFDATTVVTSRERLEVELYDSQVMLYKEIKYNGSTHIYPRRIEFCPLSKNIDLNPSTLIPKEKESIELMSDIYILLEGGAFYTNDISAELFQYSTMFDVLSEHDVRELVNRLYNLPIRPKFSITLHNNLGLLDQGIDELDEFFRGYK